MGGGAVRPAELRRAGIDLKSPRVRKLRALAEEIQSFPRHLSQHVGGFVITRSRLDEVVPIGNGAMDERTFVEWDKDDLDALKILKVDVLGLGMLTCIRKGVRIRRKALRREADARHHPGRGGRGLPHALPRRFARRVPGREPRADVDAAAAQAGKILRSRHRGRDRAAGPDPGRHGASLSAARAACVPPESSPTIRHPRPRMAMSTNCVMCCTRRWACRCSRNRR